MKKHPKNDNSEAPIVKGITYSPNLLVFAVDAMSNPLSQTLELTIMPDPINDIS